ncbi:MAG: site-specific integrase [Pseudomonadota bacterium]
MAIRYRAGRSAPWQTYWTNPHTKKREYANFVTEEEAKKEESLVKHRLRFDRDSFPDGTQDAIQEQQPEYNTLEAIYLQYLRSKQFSKTELRRQIYSMRKILCMIGSKEITDIGKQDIEHVMDTLKASDVKPVTVRSYLAVLRACLNWAAEEGLCAAITFPKLPPPHYEKFVPPSPEEIRAIFAVAPPRIQRVVIIGSQFGVRVGECELFNLTWSDVDLIRATLRVHGSKKNAGQMWREVPIRKSLLPIFKEWAEEDDYKGPLIHYKGKAVKSVKHAWSKALKLAGITRHIRPYDLRHAFATEAIAGGVDVGTVSKLMGHSTPTMVLRHYQHVLDRQKRAAVEVLPDVPIVPQPLCHKKKALTFLS